MPEVASPGEDHGHVMAIRHLDRHLVPDAAAWLDDGGDSGLRRDLDAIGEGEVGVARP